MLKLVLGEYRCRFPALLKVYCSKGILYVWWVFYMALILKLDVMRYSIGIIPMMSGLFLSRMFPNQLHKLLFLCPMTEHDRKKYLATAYGVRVGIPLFLYFAMSLLLVISDGLLFFEYIEVSLLVISFVMGANMYHALLSPGIAKREGVLFWPAVVYSILSLVVQFITWWTMIFFASIGKHELEPHIDEMILLILVLIVVLLNIVMLIIGCRPMLRYGMNYENCRTICMINKE